MCFRRGSPPHIDSFALVLTCCLVVQAAWPGPVHSQEEREREPDRGSLSIDAAVDIALANYPGLMSARDAAAAMTAIPDQAGALPDPMLSLNVMNLPVDTFNLSQEPMTQLQVGISQAIPFPGKRTLRRAASQAEAGAAEARYEERRQRLIGEVRDAWWRLFALDRALEIVSQNRELLRGFVEIAEARYAVGKGLQQDVLLAQVELSRLLDRKTRLRGRRHAIQGQLNALLDRETDRPLVLPTRPRQEALPELPDLPVLLADAAASRPLVAMQSRQLEAADQRLALARRDRLPDFRLGAGYGRRSGTDPVRGDRADLFSVMFSVSLPVYASSKQDQAIAQRSSERSQQAHALRETLRTVQAEIATSYADYESGREQVLLLKTAIIPQAEQTVAAMLAAYQVNKVDFLNVINGQLMLYDAQIRYWEALAAAKGALASLAAATGQEVLYE